MINLSIKTAENDAHKKAMVDYSSGDSRESCSSLVGILGKALNKN